MYKEKKKQKKKNFLSSLFGLRDSGFSAR